MELLSKRYWYEAVVKRVVDGDTVIADWHLGAELVLQHRTFRLAGINAPELLPKTPPRRGTLGVGCIVRSRMTGCLMTVTAVSDERDKAGNPLKLTTGGPGEMGAVVDMTAVLLDEGCKDALQVWRESSGYKAKRYLTELIGLVDYGVSTTEPSLDGAHVIINTVKDQQEKYGRYLAWLYVPTACSCGERRKDCASCSGTGMLWLQANELLLKGGHAVVMKELEWQGD